MLTPAQQKVKQELEELQVNGLLLSDRNHEPLSKKKPTSYRYFYIMTILFLISAGSVYYIKTVNNQHAGVKVYLTKVQAYNQLSEKLLEAVMKNQKAAPEQIRKAAATQNQLVQKTEALDAPASFKEHKQDLIEVIKQRESVLLSLAASKQASLLELNVKQELAKESFEKALEKENITYQLQEDGTVVYWVHTKSYQY